MPLLVYLSDLALKTYIAYYENNLRCNLIAVYRLPKMHLGGCCHVLLWAGREEHKNPATITRQN